MTPVNQSPVEGMLYRTYKIDDYTFDIYYGYYNEEERDLVEPLPVFPDLLEERLYAATGEMIVTSLQSPCELYRPKDHAQPEEWCGDCHCYTGGKSEVGLCAHPENRI